MVRYRHHSLNVQMRSDQVHEIEHREPLCVQSRAPDL